MFCWVCSGTYGVLNFALVRQEFNMILNSQKYIYIRVVAKGFTQVQYVDYHETTSPTAVEMIAAIANEKGLPVFHLDVSQAFVQAPLEEEICMRLPSGCGELSGKVVKLL